MVKIDDYERIVHKIMLESVFVGLALDFNKKNEADKKMIEVIKWLKDNYKIENRSIDGENKNGIK